jgi:hypothetical protein
MSKGTNIINSQCSKGNSRFPWLAGLVVFSALTACSRQSTTDSISHAVLTAADRGIAAGQGCTVSNVDRKPDETVEWSGLCKSGLAEGNGVARWLTGSREIGRDDGEFRGGKMNGMGGRGFDNGDYYAGSFTDGVPNGKGILRFSQGVRDRYIGEFRDGLPNGTGTLYLGDGSTYSGEFRNGEPIEHVKFSPPGSKQM